MTVRLPANRPAARFYRGGARIAELRGESSTATHEPEDWIASVTTVFGEAETGLTRLPDGRLLRDAIAQEPVAWLGAEHSALWGADARLLVKLLDAGQRLPVHAHPHDDFAARHLGRAHGKAEAWYILEGGTVHVGLRRDATVDELAALVASQDADALLALLHEVPVEPGDVVWVPPGELHAIGEGVFLLELQQPEDLSILLEWRDFAIDGAVAGHLGLGFEAALGAVTLQGRTADDLARLISPAPPSGSVLPREADEYFRLERRPVDGSELAEGGFAVLLVTRGPLAVNGEQCPTGSTVLARASDGPIAIDGTGEVLIARPPSAH